MSDTEAKNDDRVSQDRDDAGDDEVRDGLSAAPITTSCAWRPADG